MPIDAPADPCRTCKRIAVIFIALAFLLGGALASIFQTKSSRAKPKRAYSAAIVHVIPEHVPGVPHLTGRDAGGEEAFTAVLPTGDAGTLAARCCSSGNTGEI